MSNVPAETDRDVTAEDERVVEGIGVAPGIAIGTVHRYQLERPEVTCTHINSDEVEEELRLLDEALERAEQELSQVHSVARDRLDAEGEAILEAQEMMLRDDEVLTPVRERIRDDHESAAYALSNVLQSHRRRLEASDDDYLRERAGDLEELETRLLQSLQRGKTASVIKPNSIVVADRLSAADVIRFSRRGMLGCVTSHGGQASHVSIIARSLNLPAVTGADDIMSVVSDHDPVILDGRRGHLIVHPTADTLDQYRERRARQEALRSKQAEEDDSPTETIDGRRITLRANVDFGETLDSLDQHGAEGIGLMRTEVLLLSDETDSLTEETQVEVYRKAAETAGRHGATIRLLDLGGDKALPFSRTEENPFLGWRGVRVLLDRPDELLRPQIRALLRANRYGQLRILIPMVTHLDEVHRVRAIVDEEHKRLDEEGIPHDPDLPIGVMVEVPAVALQADHFANAADFLSIGTNDLTQYTLAVDRGNDLVAGRYDALHPAVLQLIQRTVEAGRATDTAVALCGEVAGDIYALPILLGFGLEILSVSPPYLPTVRHVIRETSYSEAHELATDVITASDGGTVRQRVRAWCDQNYESDFFASTEE